MRRGIDKRRPRKRTSGWGDWKKKYVPTGNRVGRPLGSGQGFDDGLAARHEAGASISQLSRETGLDRRTVRKALGQTVVRG